jgi:hypothetical protein
MPAQFTWNSSKAAINLRKHGVAFQEALTVFADPLARIHDDPEHSMGEPREVIVGHSTRNRLLVVVFIERESEVRVISARRATRHEREEYEEFTKST